MTSPPILPWAIEQELREVNMLQAGKYARGSVGIVRAGGKRTETSADGCRSDSDEILILLRWRCSDVRQTRG